jgi:hypothetical protein
MMVVLLFATGETHESLQISLLDGHVDPDRLEPYKKRILASCDSKMSHAIRNATQPSQPLEFSEEVTDFYTASSQVCDLECYLLLGKQPKATMCTAWHAL